MAQSGVAVQRPEQLETMTVWGPDCHARPHVWCELYRQQHHTFDS